MKIWIASLGVFAGSLVAAPALAGDAYVIDASHTQVLFSVERFGFNSTIGAFTDVKGTLDLDEEHPEKSTVNVQIATNSLWSGHAERERHVMGEKWLNVEKYPTITFTSTNVTLDGDKKAMVAGDLTIWGQTHSAVLEVVLNKIGTDITNKKKAAGFSAQTRIKRSDYGHTLAAPLVGDVVTIKIEALAHLKE